MLTFDDGAASAVEAAEQLARRSWPGHFFIATDLVGSPGFLGWDDVCGLGRAGHVIGSHSCSHPDRMAACSGEQLLDEWSRSAGVLAEALGRPVSTASVPGGLYSSSVGRAAAAAGFTTLFTSLAEPAPGLDRRLPADRQVCDPPRHAGRRGRRRGRRASRSLGASTHRLGASRRGQADRRRPL